LTRQRMWMPSGQCRLQPSCRSLWSLG
jgi:hypothetical protein